MRSLLDRKIRGFRLVDLIALGVLVALILGVYLAKTMAGRERAQIASAEKQIDEEHTRIRLLQAEVAHLEEPSRIERLAETYLGMQPVPIGHQLDVDSLSVAAVQPQPGVRHPAAGAPTGVVAQ